MFCLQTLRTPQSPTQQPPRLRRFLVPASVDLTPTGRGGFCYWHCSTGVL